MWLGIACIILAIGLFSKYPVPFWAFGVIFIVVSFGVYFMLSAGHFILTQEGVTHRNAFGTYQIFWRDVRRIEFGGGTILLRGEDSRFALVSPGMWSGRHKPDANTLLVRKIEASGIVPCPSSAADYKGHKNVKVRNSPPPSVTRRTCRMKLKIRPNLVAFAHG
jgi:hypothetical protein